MLLCESAVKGRSARRMGTCRLVIGGGVGFGGGSYWFGLVRFGSATLASKLSESYCHSEGHEGVPFWWKNREEQCWQVAAGKAQKKAACTKQESTRVVVG